MDHQTVMRQIDTQQNDSNPIKLPKMMSLLSHINLIRPRVVDTQRRTELSGMGPSVTQASTQGLDDRLTVRAKLMGTTQDGGNSYLHYQVIEGLGDNSNLPCNRTSPTDNNEVVQINVPINCVIDKNLKSSTKPGLRNAT